LWGQVEVDCIKHQQLLKTYEIQRRLAYIFNTMFRLGGGQVGTAHTAMAFKDTDCILKLWHQLQLEQRLCGKQDSPEIHHHTAATLPQWCLH
jgi:hypothetical protein